MSRLPITLPSGQTDCRLIVWHHLDRRAGSLGLVFRALKPDCLPFLHLRPECFGLNGLRTSVTMRRPKDSPTRTMAFMVQSAVPVTSSTGALQRCN